MAGHSKWANIKHRKGKADALKGKLFSRITKEIISAVKQGGPDPKSNSKLRLVILKAREANLPNDNIERNIKKATSQDQADYTQMTYELYGYGGVGILVDVMTDKATVEMTSPVSWPAGPFWRGPRRRGSEPGSGCGGGPPRRPAWPWH